jgi:tetratricopeptide (TPR) repeat protein
MSTEAAPPGPGPAEAGWRAALAPAAIAVVALATYAGALRGGFAWDDVVFLPPGPKLLGPVAPSFFFTSSAFAFANGDFPAVPIYRPVFSMVLWLLAPVFGGSTIAWHALPIVLHALDSVLVFALARRLLGGASPAAAIAGGLLFAVLPCHAEGVSWILAFPHPLATLLALLAAHAQLSHAREGRVAWLGVATLAATAATLTGEGALVVPPLLVGLEALERRRAPRPATWACAAVALAIPILLRGAFLAAAVPLARDAAAVGRIADFGAAYVRDLVSPWPPPPHSTYPAGGVSGPWTWIVASSVAVATGLWIARLPAGARARPLAAVAWILAALALPVLAAANPTPFYGPRALYLPSVGLALLTAAAVARLAPAWRARLRWPAAALVLAGIAIGNVQASYWLDEETVLRRMIVADPRAAGAHVKLARILETDGCRAEAGPHFEAAVRWGDRAGLRARATEAWAVYLASCRGRADEAAALLDALLAEQPGMGSAWTNAGNVALVRGDARRARECYERALAIDPRDEVAAQNLERARAVGGR